MIGSLGDPHVSEVLNCLPVEFTVVLDADSLPEVLLYADDEHTVVRDLAGIPVVIDRASRTRGWIRRLSPPEWDHGSVIGSLGAAALATQLAALAVVLRDSSIEWLTPVDAQLSSENKLLQARCARDEGIPIPKTFIGGSANFLREKLGTRLVVKPLGPGNYEDSGVQRVIYTQSVEAGKLKKLDTMRPVFISQELIEAEAHLRIVTVGEKTWGSYLPAGGRSLDWREEEESHASFIPCELTGSSGIRVH